MICTRRDQNSNCALRWQCLDNGHE